MKFLALTFLTCIPAIDGFTSPFSPLRAPPSRAFVKKAGGGRLVSGMGQLSSLFMSSSEEATEKKDEQEWQTVVSAFELYKSAFGDLKVSYMRTLAIHHRSIEEDG